jgi:hypothetical protein
MKRTIFFFLFIALASLGAKSQQATGTWQANITFSLPELKPEAIQYSFVDFDPMEAFIKKFDKSAADDAIKNAKTEDGKNMTLNAWIEAGWDFLFYNIKGNDVWLLTNKGSVNMADVTSATKKWLISKTFYLDNKPYCFSLPINATIGAKQDCHLDKNNMISLMDVYQKKIRAKK